MSFAEIITSIEMGMIYGIVAVGTYLTFRIIDFPDLTCDGSFILGAAVSAVIINEGNGSILAIVAATLAGTLAGFITGILAVKFRVTNLLSGILVAFMLYSINLRIMGGVPNITLLGLDSIFTHSFGILALACICIVIIASLGYILNTDFGLALRAIGQNKRFAQNSGINFNKMTIIGLAISNGIIALGGSICSQHQGFVDIGGGIGTVIVGLASVMIGERILQYRSMFLQILSCFIGSIVYRLFIGVALHAEILGLEARDLNLVTGILVVVIMYIPLNMRIYKVFGKNK